MEVQDKEGKTGRTHNFYHFTYIYNLIDLTVHPSFITETPNKDRVCNVRSLALARDIGCGLHYKLEVWVYKEVDI